MSLGNKANNPLQARFQGVRTARDGTAQSTGQPLTVKHVVEAKWEVVNYINDRGQEETALFIRIGEEYYAPADTVAWCANLRPMTDWLKDKVAAHRKSQAPVVVPDRDDVDVMGGEEG